MTAAFLDTSFLIALELANDQNHDPAVAHWRQTLDLPPDIVTTTFVLAEVVTFFNSRGHHAKAVEVGNSLLHSPLVELIHVDQELFARGWAYFSQHQDKRYSLADCISFIVMTDNGIATALSFDAHFRQAGFVAMP